MKWSYCDRFNVLPNSGGLDRQDARVMEIFGVFASAKSRIEKEQNK